MELAEFVRDFAEAMQVADALRPQARSRRGTRLYRPGIGPYAEDAAVDLTLSALQRIHPQRYVLQTGIRYPASRQKCDLGIGDPLEWAVEVKMARLSGDNGKPDDTSVQQVLSPFSTDRSAVSDAHKLVNSSIAPHKAVLIYGFNDEARPLLTLIDAFEALAGHYVSLGQRNSAAIAALSHPVFQSGAVFAWSVRALGSSAID